MTQIEWGVSLIFIIGISCQRAVEAYKDREGGGDQAICRSMWPIPCCPLRHVFKKGLNKVNKQWKTKTVKRLVKQISFESTDFNN